MAKTVAQDAPAALPDGMVRKVYEKIAYQQTACQQTAIELKEKPQRCRDTEKSEVYIVGTTTDGGTRRALC